MERSTSNESTEHVHKKSKRVDNRDASASKNATSLSRVERVLGVTEQELVKQGPEERKKFIVLKQIEDDGGDEQPYFVNIKTGELTPIGSFTTPTVGELRHQVMDGKASTAEPNTKPAASCNFYALYNIDIGELQTRLRTNDKCLVQIASNFNCLCVPRRSKAPDCGDLVETAHKSRTQGPAATFGPLASNLYRTHFCVVAPTNCIGQTLQQQVNLLDNVTKYTGQPVNGKLTLQGYETPIIHENESEINQVVDAVRVGLQTDCRILYGRNKEHQDIRMGSCHDDNESSIDIDQCHGATVNWKSLTTDHTRNYIPPWTQMPKKQAEILVLTRALLRATYEGIYLAALKRRRCHLYLTLVGGGVFGNPNVIIVEELARAHKLWANHPHSCLEGVYLCAYSETDNVEDLLKEQGVEISTDTPTASF